MGQALTLQFAHQHHETPVQLSENGTCRHQNSRGRIFEHPYTAECTRKDIPFFVMDVDLDLLGTA